MSRGFVFASPSEMIIDSVAVVGSKALSVKAPWLCLHRAHHRYSGKRGCGIIHDWRGHPSNARSNRNKAEHLGVTGPRAVLISTPRHQLKGSCTVEPLCIFRMSILALDFAFTHKKTHYVFACGIIGMFCLNLAGHVGGRLWHKMIFFFPLRRTDIFSITVISLWTKLWNHILLSFIMLMKLRRISFINMKLIHAWWSWEEPQAICCLWTTYGLGL